MKSICPYCQNSFIPKRIDALYCCPSHKQMAYKERKLNLSVNLKSLQRLQLIENDAEPSINLLSRKQNTSTKMIYPSTQESEQNQKPSINEEDDTHYPSIKGSQQDQKSSTSTPNEITYPSIDTLKENKTQQKDDETKYKHYKSSFVDRLFQLKNERDNTSKLADLFWNDTTGDYLW